MISKELFFNTMLNYNLAIQPFMLLTYLLAIVTYFLTITKAKRGKLYMFSFLGLLWGWNGAIELILFFHAVSIQYVIWGAIWIVQGLAFLWYGWKQKQDNEKPAGSQTNIILGTTAIIYALIVYPILGSLLGHPYPHGPIFGVAPCPVCIFTFGVLILCGQSYPISLYVFPGIWSLLGLFAALKMGVYADLGETFFGILGIIVLVRRRRIFKAQDQILT